MKTAILQIAKNPFPLDHIYVDGKFFIAVDEVDDTEGENEFYFKVGSNFRKTVDNLCLVMTAAGVKNKIIPSRDDEILIEIHGNECSDVLSAAANSFL